jgi:hypothetical protein
MPDGVAHPSHETVPPLGHRDLEPGLRREGPEDADAGGPRLPVVEPDAAAEPYDGGLRRHAAHLRVVDARDRLSRVQEPRREAPVVREQQQPRRIHVEAPDRMQALADAVQEAAHGRAPLGVLERGDDTAGLVEHDRPPLAPSSRTTRPLTLTRPARMSASARRRDAIPAALRIFWRRSSSG